jgi:hypothetical protein
MIDSYAHARIDALQREVALLLAEAFGAWQEGDDRIEAILARFKEADHRIGSHVAQ